MKEFVVLRLKELREYLIFYKRRVDKVYIG